MSAGAVVSIVRGDDLELDEPLFSMPADRLRLQLDHDFKGETRVGASATLVSRQNRVREGLDFAEPPDGYTLFGLEASSRIARGESTVRLSLTVENLLNTTYRDYLSRYRYFIEDPGRTVALRIHIPISR